MARVDASRDRHWLVPRFPLEMAIASLATLIGTAVVFDLPHRGAPQAVPEPEKVSLQAPLLPKQMQAQGEDHTASRFMEAVALSHLGPLRPQTEVDRGAAEPPPAVQVFARAPTRDKPRPPAVVAAPLPPARTVTAVAPLAKPVAVVDPRPAEQQTIVAKPPAAQRGFHVPVVSDLAEKTRDTVVGGFQSVGRGIESLLPNR